MRLCDEKFRLFCLAITGKTFELEELLGVISSALPTLASSINLARLEVKISAARTIYEQNGFLLERVLYQDAAGYGVKARKDDFFIESGGSISVIAYPPLSYTWTLEDEENIALLSLTVYESLSRARLLHFMRLTQESDALTGALNSQGFQKRVLMVLREGHGSDYAAIFSNIKNFKYINSQLGQENGDLILRQFCFINEDFIKQDGYFCRLGGDNFITLIKKARLEAYLDFTTNIKIPVSKNGENTLVNIVLKQGVYAVTAESSMGDIMGNPSVALSVARVSKNLNVVYFKPEMLKKTLHDKSISSSFPEALEKKEFLVYYQPKVDLATNTLCGCEALTRWQHDQLISPADFIMVLEHEGSIRNLDFYMLENVCADIRSWLNKGITPVRVSTNFSKVHLVNENLERDILSVVKKYDVPPEYLEIELTELSDYSSYARLLKFVNTIHNYGIHISIDDFGTGYSSVKLLKELQADVIKLDKSLIDNIKLNVGGNTDEIVSRNLIHMAKELKIEVIAEGVETEYQADFLRKNGCSMAQGFLYDKPLPREVFENLLKSSRKYEG